MVSASLMMLLDNADCEDGMDHMDNYDNEDTDTPSSSQSTDEADARLLLSLCAVVTSPANPAATLPSPPSMSPSSPSSSSMADYSSLSHSHSTNSITHTSSPPHHRTIAVHAPIRLHAPIPAPPRPDASLPSHLATNNYNHMHSAGPPQPTMVILRELSDYEAAVKCAFCKCVYSTPETLRKHILARHGSVLWRQSTACKNEISRSKTIPALVPALDTFPKPRAIPLASPTSTSAPIKRSNSRDLRNGTDSQVRPRQTQHFLPPRQQQTSSHLLPPRSSHRPPAEHLYPPRPRQSPVPLQSSSSVSSISSTSSSTSSSVYGTPRANYQDQRNRSLLPPRGSYLPSPEAPPSRTEPESYQFPLPKVVPGHSTHPVHHLPPRKVSANSGIRLPPLKTALTMDPDRPLYVCSACRQRGDHCHIDPGKEACRACLLTNRPCDLRLPDARPRAAPPTAAQSSLGLHSQPRQVVHHPHAPQANRVDIYPVASASKQPVEVLPVQQSLSRPGEEEDKFKLPRAWKPAPPPHAPPLTSPPKSSPPRVPIPYYSGERPRVYKHPTGPAGAPSTAFVYPSVLSTTGKEKSLSARIMTAQRSFSDPFLLPPAPKGPFNASTSSVGRIPDADERESHSGSSTSFPDRPPAGAQGNAEPKGQPRIPAQNPTGPLTASELRTIFMNDPNYVHHQKWLANHLKKDDRAEGEAAIGPSTPSASSASSSAKRARPASPEEGSLPEDQRGTTTKRPRKTTGFWQPRRPQTACEACRSKKMNCAIEPGRTACDRCIRKRITCGLPPARLQEIQTGVHEDMSATSKQMKNKDSIDNRALFLNLKPECYTPASFSQLTDEDWKNIRQFIVLQMCTILANTDSELWEDFKNNLPESECLKDLLSVFFVNINPSMPILHPATFDPRTAAWELTVSLASLALSSQGLFTAARFIREALLTALNMRTPIRAVFSSKPVTSIEQAILLLNAFKITPQSGLPSQWPTDFDNFFEKLCLAPEEQSSQWKDWIMQEERTRTAFGFYFVNLFRHVLTFDMDNRLTAPRLAGRRLPAPSQAWYAGSEEDWRASNALAKIPYDSLITQALRKGEDRPLLVCRNTFYLQVALLRQSFVEMSSSRMPSLGGGSLSGHSLREEGRILTERIDSVFSSLTPNKPEIRLWKPDLVSLFLLHHVLALLRVYSITSLCEIAETNANFDELGAVGNMTENQRRELSRVCLWRAAHILQAIQKATSMQSQQLIVPYALFVSVLFLCATPNLPSSEPSRTPTPAVVHLAEYWTPDNGDLQLWIKGYDKRLPAIALRTTSNPIHVLSPSSRLRLLQEAIDMMEQFRLPDRAARSFRDILARRLEAERQGSKPANS